MESSENELICPDSVPQKLMCPLRSNELLTDRPGQVRNSRIADNCDPPTFVDSLEKLGFPRDSAQALHARVGMVATADLPKARQKATLDSCVRIAAKSVSLRCSPLDLEEVHESAPQAPADPGVTALRDPLVVPLLRSEAQAPRGPSSVTNVTAAAPFAGR